jgi:hypothetical protein
MRTLFLKSGALLLVLFVLSSFVQNKPSPLEWTLLYDTSWQQKSDETNNANIWVPTFTKKLKSLSNKEVAVTGYISVDAKGDYIITQFKRNLKNKKDFTLEPPDYILLSGWDNSTYFAELKKYTVSGTLVLNEFADSGAAFSLLSPQLQEK